MRYKNGLILMFVAAGSYACYHFSGGGQESRDRAQLLSGEARLVCMAKDDPEKLSWHRDISKLPAGQQQELLRRYSARKNDPECSRMGIGTVVASQSVSTSVSPIFSMSYGLGQVRPAP